jgi:transposase
MKLYAGIDLHSSNNYVSIVDQDFNRLFEKRIPNELDDILGVLNPYKPEINGVIVESTYNWYWLADGLEENGYSVHLANPAAIKQYEGLKHTDDKWDSFFLAKMKHLDILPEGYIYPKEERPLRDLLRRRMFFVQQRTANILSLQSSIIRNLGLKMSANQVKRLRPKAVEKLFSSDDLILMAQSNISLIKTFDNTINEIEKRVKSKVKLKEEFKKLTTTPGIGFILGSTIMLEVGDIARFQKVGNYSSYCRCVGSQRISNGKKKGENNTKNGNKYLAWAYIEAANFARRYLPVAQKFYQKKMAKSNVCIATKALANKLARATYYMMRDKIPFDEEMLFGESDEAPRVKQIA